MKFHRAAQRGHTTLDWLDSYHTFSFGDYYDPSNQGFSVLRVINDDVVKPAAGFGMHGHQDMEIVTYVLSGALAHQDSLGNNFTIAAGDVQRMTAGTGIRHSEFNASSTHPVHFLQIWIYPETKGLVPGYEQIPFHVDEKQDQWRLIASPEGQEGSLIIHQQAYIYASVLTQGKNLKHEVQPERAAWLHIATGEIEVNNQPFSAGDGIALFADEPAILTGLSEQSEVLLFDLPPVSR